MVGWLVTLQVTVSCSLSLEQVAMWCSGWSSMLKFAERKGLFMDMWGVVAHRILLQVLKHQWID
jgi:hypothetical protein